MQIKENCQGSLTVIKTWKNDNKPIAGATIVLMMQNRMTSGFTEAARKITGANGQAKFENLILGQTYRIEELEVPGASAPLGKPLGSDTFIPTLDNLSGNSVLQASSNGSCGSSGGNSTGQPQAPIIPALPDTVLPNGPQTGLPNGNTGGYMVKNGIFRTENTENSALPGQAKTDHLPKTGSTIGFFGVLAAGMEILGLGLLTRALSRKKRS